MIRRYIAAPGVGLVAEDNLQGGHYLSDRKANGEAFPGERIVRLPRRLFRRPQQRAHGWWAMKFELRQKQR